MCGIVGSITAENGGHNNRRNFVEQGLYVDALRGFHSTGLFTIHGKDKTVTVHKKAMMASDFLDMRRTQSILNFQSDVIIGHNRHATMGAHTHHNAHPFNFGKVTGVHNGTLEYGWRDYLPAGQSFNVDSEAIMNAFAQQPYQEIIEKIKGAFTFVWHDSEDGMIRIVRNKERPIYIGKVTKDDTFLLASEKGMLQWIGARNGFTFEDIFQPEPGELLQFPVDDPMNMTMEKVKLYTAPVYQGNNMGGRYHNNVARFPRGQQGEFQTITTYESLGLKRGEDYIWHLQEYTKYNQRSDSGYLVGRLSNLKDKDGDDIKCVIHGLNIDAVLKETGCKTIRDVGVIGTPAGLTTANVGKKPAVILMPKDIAFFDILSPDETEEDYEDDDVPFEQAMNDNGFEVYVPGPDGRFIDKEEFEKLTADGCCMCSDPLDWDHAEDVTWLAGNNPVCSDDQCKILAKHYMN